MSNLFANKYIIKIRIAFNYLRRKEVKPQLGRWNINYDPTNINSKVDLANEDHCGSCGKYAEEKQKTINDVNLKEKDQST